MKNILLSTVIALTAVTGCSKTDSAKEAAEAVCAAANDTAVQEANDQEKEAGQSKAVAKNAEHAAKEANDATKDAKDATK